MSTSFPFVEVSSELYPAIGEPLGDSRVYQKAGAQEESEFWYNFIVERFGHCVSPGGVSMFAPVSRAAVHKRIKEGKLTCFKYETTHRKRNLFGSVKDVREMDIVMIPISECKAWGEEIKERALADGRVTREELEGDKPDWHGMFLQPNSKWERQQMRKAKGSRR